MNNLFFQEREQIRAALRLKRKNISFEDKKNFSIIGNNHLINSNYFLRAKNIACYINTANEIATNLIIKKIWDLKKNCYLPVVDKTSLHNLLFVKYNARDKLILNSFNIQEPIMKTQNIIAPEKLDLVIVPLLGFDKFGNRIGSGAGFYDRTFAFMHHENVIIKPILIGLSFNVQQLKKIETHKLDVKLDNVVTEFGFINSSVK